MSDQSTIGIIVDDLPVEVAEEAYAANPKKVIAAVRASRRKIRDDLMNFHRPAKEA